MSKRSRKILTRGLLVLVVGLVAFLAAVYLLASWVPRDYRPERLTETQKHDVVSQFVNKVLNKFGSDVDTGKPFSISFTEKQLNSYLAAMDAIAAARPSVKYGSVYRLMDRAGLAEPAVHMSDGGLTVMVRSRAYEKVLSASLTFDFGPQGELKIGMSGAHIGRAPVPAAVVRERLAILKKVLVREKRKVERTTRPIKGIALIGFSTQDIGRIIAAAITAVDERPIPPDHLISKVSGSRRIRLTRIDLTTGQMTLHFVPVEKDKADAATGGKSASGATEAARPRGA